MSDESPPRGFRWQALLQRAADPLFVLDRRRRLLFANRAWEQLVGLPLEHARGLVCRRPRPVGPDAPAEDLLAHVLTPPPEVSHGRFGRARRLFVPRAHGLPQAPQWWDIEFFPLRQAEAHEGYLLVGRVLPLAVEGSPSQPVLPERLEGLRLRRASRHAFDLLASVKPVMHRLARQARLASQVNAPVLMLGERGTGKTTLARIIHAQGPNRERAFAALDCRRIPPSLLADLLLEDRSGARWSCLGTIYLAEPALLPRDLQVRLCEWLATDEADRGPRLIVGTAKDPEAEVAAGRLLEEFRCRLSTLVLQVPALRERREDLPALAGRFLSEEGVTGKTFTSAAGEALAAHRWPGNLTELRRVVLTAAGRASGERIDLNELPMALREARLVEQTPAVRPPATPGLEETLAQVERRMIQLALRRTGGNRSRAADLLGVHRPRLLRRMEALGLVVESNEGE